MILYSIIIIFITGAYGTNPYKISTISDSVSGLDVGYDSYYKAVQLSNLLSVTITSVTIVNNTPMSFVLWTWDTQPVVGQALISPSTVGTYAWIYTSPFKHFLVFRVVDIVNSYVGQYLIMDYSYSANGQMQYRMWVSDVATYPPSPNPSYVSMASFSGNCCYTIIATNTYNLRVDLYQSDGPGTIRWIVTLSDFTNPPMQC